MILDIHNITVKYEQKTALQNASLQIHPNDFIGIIGPNGGGKSTLLRAILKLIPLTEGIVTYYRNQQETDRLTIGYLPQYNKIDKEFPISAKEVILSGLSGSKNNSLRIAPQQLEELHQIIQQMGLQGKENKPIGTLSGGELQRTFLGRALISRPELLILDEPNSYIDMEFEGRLTEILQEANLTSAILLVSHNIPSVQALAKSLVCINRTLHHHPTTHLSEQCLLETFLTR